MVSASVRRRQVEFACRRGLSCRRACSLLGVARSALRYESRRELADAPVVTPMAALAAVSRKTEPAAPSTIREEPRASTGRGDWI
jgi:hypothetical protein